MYACVEDHNRVSCRRCVSAHAWPCSGHPGVPLLPARLQHPLCVPQHHAGLQHGLPRAREASAHQQLGFPLAALHLAVPGAVAESGESQEVVVTSTWGSSWVWMAENRQPQPEPWSVEANASLEGMGLSPQQMG